MKREARIVITASYGGCYAALVVRGESLDGVSVASSCAGLCLDLASRGFLGEARYALGPCTCGLPPPPSKPGFLGYFEDFAAQLAREASSLATLNRPARGPCRGPGVK